MLKCALSVSGLSGLVLLAITGFCATAPADLPPRPTPLPSQAPPIQGATLDLRLTFPATWPWEDTHWQTLWTAVQWQDAQGAWHTVPGWQGQLERVWQDTGRVVGQKVWWVAPEDLGTGPFRWVIYAKRDGGQLAASDAFMLPQATSAWLDVWVAVAPP